MSNPSIDYDDVEDGGTTFMAVSVMREMLEHLPLSSLLEALRDACVPGQSPEPPPHSEHRFQLSIMGGLVHDLARNVRKMEESQEFFKEFMAQARLHVAAPELLEACELAIGLLCTDGALYEPTLKMMRAAIAKARGQQ